MKGNSMKFGKIIANLLVALVMLIVVIFVVPKIAVFFMPFIIGWIIALIANPPVKFLSEKLKIKRKAGTAIVIIVVIIGVILSVYGIGSMLIEQATGYINSLPEMWIELEKDLSAMGKHVNVFMEKLPVEIQEKYTEIYQNVDVYIADFVTFMGTPTVNAVGNLAKNLPGIIISVIMCSLSAYFFILEKDYMTAFWKNNMPNTLQKKWGIILESIKATIGGYIKAQIKIELWIYLLLLIGLSILRVEYAMFIALGMAIIDIVPFLGTAIVLVPWAIVNILSGDFQMAIGLLIIWGVSQLVRQIIQPKIVGDTIGMKPIPTLFLLFIGFKVGGVVGMIVALPIGIVIVSLWKEGAFDTTINSGKLLLKGLNEFRKLDKEDMELLNEDYSEKEK